jgi:hypothetical protein
MTTAEEDAIKKASVKIGEAIRELANVFYLIMKVEWTTDVNCLIAEAMKHNDARKTEVKENWND